MGEMTVREAGRKGGMTVREKHGPEFFREIGRKGGQATWKAHGREFYQEIGKKGGQKGGARVRELIEKGKSAS
ncbi:MAG: KGG domain-containing protein [Armatimonadota bacterium]